VECGLVQGSNCDAIDLIIYQRISKYFKRNIGYLVVNSAYGIRQSAEDLESGVQTAETDPILENVKIRTSMRWGLDFFGFGAEAKANHACGAEFSGD